MGLVLPKIKLVKIAVRQQWTGLRKGSNSMPRGDYQTLHTENKSRDASWRVTTRSEMTTPRIMHYMQKSKSQPAQPGIGMFPIKSDVELMDLDESLRPRTATHSNASAECQEKLVWTESCYNACALLYNYYYTVTHFIDNVWESKEKAVFCAMSPVSALLLYWVSK